MHSALGLVAAGLGFTFIPASFAVNNRSDVVFIPIADLPSETSVVAVTMADQDNHLVKAFVDILLRLARPQDGGTQGPRRRLHPLAGSSFFTPDGALAPWGFGQPPLSS